MTCCVSWDAAKAAWGHPRLHRRGGRSRTADAPPPPPHSGEGAIPGPSARGQPPAPGPVSSSDGSPPRLPSSAVSIPGLCVTLSLCLCLCPSLSSRVSPSQGSQSGLGAHVSPPLAVVGPRVWGTGPGLCRPARPPAPSPTSTLTPLPWPP